LGVRSEVRKISQGSPTRELAEPVEECGFNQASISLASGKSAEERERIAWDRIDRSDIEE
jgi:hypothetical protein